MTVLSLRKNHLKEQYAGTIIYGRQKQDIKYWKNPSQKEMWLLLNKAKYGSARFSIDKNTGDLYAWDAAYLNHFTFNKEAGINADNSGFMFEKGNNTDLRVFSDGFMKRDMKIVKSNKNFQRMVAGLDVKYTNEFDEEQLDEQYGGEFDYFGQYIQYWKNPQPKEIQSLISQGIDEFRLVSLPNGPIYAFDAKSATHQDFCAAIDIHFNSITQGFLAYDGTEFKIMAYIHDDLANLERNPNIRRLMTGLGAEGQILEQQTALNARKSHLTEKVDGIYDDKSKSTKKKVYIQQTKELWPGLPDNIPVPPRTALELRREQRELDEQFIGNYEPIYPFETEKIPVWKNPTPSEFYRVINLPNIKKELRAIVNDNGDFYMWKAALANHIEMNREIGLDVYDDLHVRFELLGNGKIKVFTDRYSDKTRFINITKQKMQRSKYFANIINDLLRHNKTNSFEEMFNLSEDLNEQYGGVFDSFGDNIKYWKNPTQSELNHIISKSPYHEARIAFGNMGDVYAFDASGSFHFKFYKETGIIEEPKFAFSVIVRKPRNKYEVVLEFDPLKFYSTVDIAEKLLKNNKNFMKMFGSSPVDYLEEEHQQLDEKFDGMFDNVYKNEVKYWVNSSIKELAGLIQKLKNLRFVHSNNTIIFWNAYDAIHEDFMRSSTAREYGFSENSKIVYGYIEIQSRIINIEGLGNWENFKISKAANTLKKAFQLLKNKFNYEISDYPLTKLIMEEEQCDEHSIQTVLQFRKNHLNERMIEWEDQTFKQTSHYVDNSDSVGYIEWYPDGNRFDVSKYTNKRTSIYWSAFEKLCKKYSFKVQMTELNKISDMYEDAPTTNAGSGAIAGIGIGPQGEPGRKGVLNYRNILRRVNNDTKKRITDQENITTKP